MKSIKLLILTGCLFILFYNTSSAQSTSDTTVSFKVFGVCSALCKPRIETAAKGRGVASAVWNVDTKMLSLVYDPSKTSVEKVQDRILDVGHDVENKKADDAVYKALPSCCYYRSMENMNDMKMDADSSQTNKNENVIKGVVLEEDDKGSFKPLIKASVMWLGIMQGTVTDENGVFSIPKNGERLIVSYTGFTADTISVMPEKELKIILADNHQLKEVKVTSAGASTYINSNDIVRTSVITQNELFKAACCNLSESFETNPSVDVSYNDAVTG
ncbi:MAG: carboxypeptidase-like regulatory domain-containing protein, partial [Parafilimonas sp.]